MADISVQGLDSLMRLLQYKFPQGLEAALARAGARIGLHCVREAKANAPRSPTKKLHSKTLKRKRISSRRQFFAGGLEKSIEHEVQADGDVSVFVAKNSYAGKYARRIHDEKGISWRNRGAGTIAKGARADDKFIARAVADNKDKYKRVYEQEIKREIAKL